MYCVAVTAIKSLSIRNFVLDNTNLTPRITISPLHDKLVQNAVSLRIGRQRGCVYMEKKTFNNNLCTKTSSSRQNSDIICNAQYTDTSCLSSNRSKLRYIRYGMHIFIFCDVAISPNMLQDCSMSVSFRDTPLGSRGQRRKQKTKVATL